MGPSGSGYDTDIWARLFGGISGVADAHLYDDKRRVLLYAVCAYRGHPYVHWLEDTCLCGIWDEFQFLTAKPTIYIIKDGEDRLA